MERDKVEEILKPMLLTCDELGADEQYEGIFFVTRGKAIEAMLEFAEQSRITEQSSVVVTDEEIYEAANKNNTSSWGGHAQGWYYHFVEGAQWMRDKLNIKDK